MQKLLTGLTQLSVFLAAVLTGHQDERWFLEYPHRSTLKNGANGKETPPSETREENQDEQFG